MGIIGYQNGRGQVVALSHKDKMTVVERQFSINISFFCWLLILLAKVFIVKLRIFV